jgi:magnesium chelatase family protein
MAVKIFSSLIQGLEAKLIEVEVDILQGMPAFSIVGLGDAAVQEAKERIHSAIKNSGANYPQQKKIINLAPAHLRKNGPNFDLPMAVGLLAATGQLKIPPSALFVGELALDGSVRPINGALSIAIFAKNNNWKEIYLPADSASEAAIAKARGKFGKTSRRRTSHSP